MYKQLRKPSLLKAAIVVSSLSVLLSCAHSAQAATTTINGVAPEVISMVFLEGQDEVATVSLNGKELISFRSETGLASQQAEELALRLQEVLQDKKFEVNDLLPLKSGDLIAFQLGGETVISFNAKNVQLEKDQTKISPLELSYKLVNDIRGTYGAPLLPQSLLKLLDQATGQIAIHKTESDTFSGQASWYGGKFNGRRASDGSIFDENKMTAAHKSLPFGTKLLVMNRKTGDSCVVKVTDRGPFIGNRVIDLSKMAASKLNMLSQGIAIVDCLVLSSN
jgi:rare lipoprotein A